MKITPANIEQFIANIPGNIKSILVYGPDEGLVSERVKAITVRFLGPNQDTSFSIAEFDYNKIKEDTSEFNSALLSLSFLRTKKLIKVYDARNALSKDLQIMLEHYAGPNLVVFIGSDLPASAAVRKYFETSKTAAALACYQDEPHILRKMISNMLYARGFTCAEDALQALQMQIYGDRRMIMNEVEKLMIFMGNKKHINLHDVMDSVIDPVTSSLDELCHSVASRNIALGETILTRLREEGTQAITIIRSLYRYFSQLYQIRIETEKGTVPTEAIKLLEPPLFFKTVPVFLQHLKSWPSIILANIIMRLSTLEAECKKTGTPVDLVLNDFIIKTASHNFK